MSLDTSKCSSGGGGAGGLEEDVEGEDKQAGELFLCTTYQIKAGFFCSLWKKHSVEKTPITLLYFAFKTQSTAGLSLLLNLKKNPDKKMVYLQKTSRFFYQNSMHALQATGLN